MSRRTTADILAALDENEALKEALHAERVDKNKWFDIALTRSGQISSMAAEISILKRELQRAKGEPR